MIYVIGPFNRTRQEPTSWDNSPRRTVQATIEDAGTDFESDPGTLENFPAGGNLNTLPLFNNTPGGTKSQLLNGGYNGQVGVAKSFAVFPGDKVKIEAYAKYEGTNSSNPEAFASALLAAFGLQAPVPGETGTASTALNGWGTLFDLGYQSVDPSAPQAYVNIIIFDKNYDFLDARYQQISAEAEQVGASPDVDHEYLMQEYTIAEEGFVFMYVSNNSPSNVYFDDVIVSHTPSSVIQYNEYYPYGLQTSNSWTRAGSKNNFLYNGSAEMNSSSGFYDLFYRNYDAAIGKFIQADPMAHMDHSVSPYAYAGNNPLMFNDPLGDVKITQETPMYNPNASFGAAALGYIESLFDAFSGVSAYDPDRQEVLSAARLGQEWALAELGIITTNVYDANDLNDNQTLVRKSDGSLAIRCYACGDFAGMSEDGSSQYYYNTYQNLAQQADASTIFHFIHDEAAAYQWMRAVQDLKDGSGRILGKEVVGVLSVNQQTGKKGVLILPWAGNFYDESKAGLGFYGSYYEDNNGNRFTPLAIVHTHPGNEIGPSTWGNTREGDLSSAPNFGGLPMYILGSLQYVQYYPSPSSPGITYDLIRSNNPASLFPK